jgi:glutaminase
MSVIKPFILLYLLHHLEPEEIWQKVGKEPSNYPFNSLTQLELDRGFPRNPMLNSGAIMLSYLVDKPAQLCSWLNAQAGCHLYLDTEMLTSVNSLPNPKNTALARCLEEYGYLEDPALALERYNYLCCLSGNIKDVARLGLHLLQMPQVAIIREIMLTCGLYEISLDFAARVGFPSKSGVSGLILSLLPRGAIAIYSPPLNAQGNSLAGLYLLEELGKLKS